jgi:ribonuclease VapC
VIVLDTSAVLAILWREPEAEDFKVAITESDGVIMSAATRLECFVVCMRRGGPALVEEMEGLLAGLTIDTAPFDEKQLAMARDAFAMYGRGRHGLNYGDCFSYALAKARDLPLLFKGEDFAATDVKRAV